MRGNLILVLGLTLVLANAFVSGEMASLWATVRGQTVPGKVIDPGGTGKITQTPDGKINLPGFTAIPGTGITINPDGTISGPFGITIPAPPK